MDQTLAVQVQPELSCPLGVHENTYGDSQELLVSGMPCCADLLGCNMAAQDMTYMPFQSCFDSQLEDSMLCL